MLWGMEKFGVNIKRVSGISTWMLELTQVDLLQGDRPLTGLVQKRCSTFCHTPLTDWALYGLLLVLKSIVFVRVFIAYLQRSSTYSRGNFLCPLLYQDHVSMEAITCCQFRRLCQWSSWYQFCKIGTRNCTVQGKTTHSKSMLVI